MLQEDLEKYIDKLSKIDEDYETVIEKPEIVPKQNTERSKKSEIREAIKPQVDIANSVMQAIATAFTDNCDQTKKMADMEEQIKSWEQQIHGACDQIIKTIEGKDGSVDRPESVVNDKTFCSPRSFNKYIKNNTSRDYSTLNLAAAIIVFYNSMS